jgi:rhamnogalacturonan endolyase
MLRGSSGVYSYGIYEHLKDWPGFELGETRIAFKLRKDKFHYMAVADDRKRIMPFPDDLCKGRCQTLDYQEASLLTAPCDPRLQGEVDDKYQYSCENKDLRVHGWISFDPPVGFWQITPSNEFRSGGPLKQNLTSHVGPTTLAVFHSTHYAGKTMMPRFEHGEPWKKVYGPVFIYLNSTANGDDPLCLWDDAKIKMMAEVERWPYSFVASDDYPKSEERGTARGRLLIRDRFINNDLISARGAYVGLAPPGDSGSWQIECKGYQFWAIADEAGYFSIGNVRPGEYNLYAWVPSFIGDYHNGTIVRVTSGCMIEMGDIVYEPPRDGPTLWEIGIPDRKASEFFIPDPDPTLVNRVLVHHQDRFRQYGLWKKYTDMYPNDDLVYTVGVSDYRRDWFFAHVPRKKGDVHEGTTWQIIFNLENIDQKANYKLRVAIASATLAELQVKMKLHFSTEKNEIRL